ncbi:protein NSP-INTERACTING KINASE 1 [Artemisia annua]|uniref:Protein NSP-INTERACTING KINASE 1 n=1 Tax=Artemisia annua TaxID=35608 RepID=A0A2U1NKH6_ARTAN|nr:protein NSP-INTERACTING KINASE 1 [Artemisia annua]
MGLLYLHEQCDPKVIHRDVKATNILLDDCCEAVVGDFGLAKLLDHQDSHVTTLVHGMVGPYITRISLHWPIIGYNEFFGFGILLLELITGQRILEFGRAANQKGAMLHWTSRMLLSIPPILELSSQLSLAVKSVRYTHGSFIFPGAQPFPHRSFAEEVAVLDIYIGKLSSAEQPVYTLEMCMTALDKKSATVFFKTPSSSAALMTEVFGYLANAPADAVFMILDSATGIEVGEFKSSMIKRCRDCWWCTSCSFCNSFCSSESPDEAGASCLKSKYKEICTPFPHMKTPHEHNPVTIKFLKPVSGCFQCRTGDSMRCIDLKERALKEVWNITTVIPVDRGFKESKKQGKSNGYNEQLPTE